jgi:DNA-directed RNA polymerase specialized sigma24 family protein
MLPARRPAYAGLIRRPLSATNHTRKFQIDQVALVELGEHRMTSGLTNQWGLKTRAQFATTHWSVVLNARGGNVPGASEALEALCRTYYNPVYGFVRREGYRPQEAQDLVQEFFGRFVEKDYLDSVDRQKGKFRSFVLACLKHFLSSARIRAGAIKRGGQQSFVPLDEWEEDYQAGRDLHLSAERTFDRNWATTIMEQALKALRLELDAAGKAMHFERLKKFLCGEPEEGEYAAVGRDFGITPGALAVSVHRMRQRYGELVRAEVANTVARPTEVDAEVQWLIEVLTTP